ncbi:16S rRNA (uracil(1498)-N(3))-methyltransferase [Tessaracoccus rhinocerotis]|uniref:Ribosomal RNA small subunit methyltransferase E n=1 Tax=Tessaracoccus rhinocerotis TaxID=1689449 RepID=A0A553K484_9ACTN|nr:16S rRNA (uracil(1498)-N(3))-methyltransferase [Tessaracoccus rhinocerotis]TRY19520.1 16S rRNA (uracil(1498)-N(3))-methyltransferase [Tessaracoccus rhinocerotis]
MSLPLFLAELAGVVVGGTATVTGDEARHAVAVKRIQVGEHVLLSDGAGRTVTGEVVTAGKQELVVRVDQVEDAPPPALEFVAVQALAKGERSELAVEMLTEVGVRRILAWQAARSIVRWQGDRAAKSLAKWQSTAREAMKQSRRTFLPEVTAAGTKDVAELLAAVDLALVLHEDATEHIAAVDLPEEGRVAVVVGPEGGISPEELETFRQAGARTVLISDGVLRTSTAGAVAVGQLEALARRPR